jgi:hypothetical protein
MPAEGGKIENNRRKDIRSERQALAAVYLGIQLNKDEVARHKVE